MAAVFALEHFAELARVGEVAVVREADAVRRVHVERLGFGGVVAAGGRVAHVAHADVALEFQHVMLLEDVAHQALALAHEQLAVGDRRDARCVLPAVLEHRQRVIDPLIDSAGSDDSGNAAHSVQVLRLRRRVWSFISSRSSFSPTMPRSASATPMAYGMQPRILPARVLVHAQRLDRRW